MLNIFRNIKHLYSPFSILQASGIYISSSIFNFTLTRMKELAINATLNVAFSLYLQSYIRPEFLDMPIFTEYHVGSDEATLSGNLMKVFRRILRKIAVLRTFCLLSMICMDKSKVNATQERYSL